ncbi:hypothetical protein MSG28_002508, partial [Choristoneura fumiferana]
SYTGTTSEREGIQEEFAEQYCINTSDGVYQVEHPIALQVAGLEKPKRKRGRPPKKPKTPEELAQEAAAKQQVVEAKGAHKQGEEGKELERIFKEEGVTDGEDSDHDLKPSVDAEAPPVSKEPEVIGHLEASGELVVVFSCVGRYMSHVAAHGPVRYRCGCGAAFPTRLDFTAHQRATKHEGQTVEPGDGDAEVADTALPAAMPDADATPDDKGGEKENLHRRQAKCRHRSRKLRPS